jgi:hypothetical protein
MVHISETSACIGLQVCHGVGACGAGGTDVCCCLGLCKCRACVVTARLTVTVTECCGALLRSVAVDKRQGGLSQYRPTTLPLRGTYGL